MSRDQSPPQLAELMARYLQNQAAAQHEGLGFAEQTGDVVPFEAVPAQPVEPRVAWEGALSVLRCFQPSADIRSLQPPPEWPVLVASHEPMTALAFGAGNFPQLVRYLHAILQANDLTSLAASPSRPGSVPALLEWTERIAGSPQFPQALLAVGALRLARDFDRAQELLTRLQESVPAEWQAALANEQAVLAWQSGKLDEAAALWQAQPESVPVLFNRGLAALFLGRPAEARAPLTRAVRELPEESAWHHLGRLYLALAEMRG